MQCHRVPDCSETHRNPYCQSSVKLVTLSHIVLRRSEMSLTSPKQPAQATSPVLLTWLLSEHRWQKGR